MPAATGPPYPRLPGELRRWQTRALDACLNAPGRDFLLTATPGAGKTTFALAAAARRPRRDFAPPAAVDPIVSPAAAGDPRATRL